MIELQHFPTDSARPATATGGRHHVTVLFSDFSGSSKLANSVAPEVNERILETVVSAAITVIGRHGGVVNQCHGDGVLAVFGFPKVQEDDVRRATEAALELHESVRNLSFASLDLPSWFVPKMHSGIDSGLVVIGGGDWIQGQYRVTGPAANTAAALSDAADADEIIATASTLHGVRPFFTTSGSTTVALKGLREPTSVYYVLGRTAVDTRFEARAIRGLTAFFGREEELRKLHRTFAEVIAGHTRVVALVGPAGLGKTRLIEEFLRRDQSQRQVCRGFCESYGEIAPLQPFLQIMRQILKLSRQGTTSTARRAAEFALNELRPALLHYKSEYFRMLGIASDTGARVPQQVNPAMIKAMAEFFRAVARQCPLLLAIDDWQWADNASRHLLGGLLGELGNSQLIVVLAIREIDNLDPATRRATVLRLAPFNRVESLRTIRALLPNCADSEAENICQQAGGNVLFLEELCDSNSRRVADPVDPGSSQIPNWLYGLIAARLQRLPTEQAALVRVAAVIGNVIPTWLLESISSHRESDDIIYQLARMDVIAAGESTGMLRFKHGLTRDAVYALIGHDEKRDLHLRIASAVVKHYGVEGRSASHETLAYHYAGGGDYRRAFCHARRAGQKAMAASSLDGARDQFLAALNALDRLPPSPRMRRRWIETALNWALPSVYGPVPEQLWILQRAVDYAIELEDDESLARSHYWLGYINYTLGEQAEAIEHCQRALAFADKLGSSRLAAQIHATLGQSYAAASQYSPALLHLDTAMTAKNRRNATGSLPVGSVYSMACKAVALADQGRFTQAHDCLDWAMRAVSGTGHEIESSLLNMRGAVLLWQGRWQETLEGAIASQEIAARVYAPYLLAMAHALEDYAGWILERDVARIESLERICHWLEDRQQRLFISFAYGWLADSFVSAKNFPQAHKYASLAMQRAGQQDRVGEAMACRAMAAVAAKSNGLADLGEHAYFEHALSSARDRGSQHEEAVTRLQQASRFIECGEANRARPLLTLATRTFESLGMCWHLSEARGLINQHFHPPAR